jgi:beta-lactamase superfamily II metal-dependent hydrolase
MLKQFPRSGFVFWPVGTGDSTTVLVDAGVAFQVDIHHMVRADQKDDPHAPAVDELVRLLPQKDKRPYLAVFVLTHPDTDHCKGFADLLKRVTIGELWFTPRIFTEYKKDLGDDAKAFRAEALRRIKVTIAAKGTVVSGDRVRVIGYDNILKEDDYIGFPKDRLSIPGHIVTELDGTDLTGRFRAFIHAPFKDDLASDRNDSSVGLQVTLYRGEALGRALLFGDLCHPTVRRIFDRSEAGDLAWNVFLAPHHCSKSVMFWKGEGDDDETLQQDILDKIGAAAQTPGYVISSSSAIPGNNDPGDNPPHAKARKRYEEIAPSGFLCTMEHVDDEEPEPIVFAMTENGLAYQGETKKVHTTDLAGAIEAARGAAEPPRDRVGFGSRG